MNDIFYLVSKINYREYQGTSIHYKIIILLVLDTKFAGTSLDYSINLKIVQTSNSYLENQDKAKFNFIHNLSYIWYFIFKDDFLLSTNVTFFFFLTVKFIKKFDPYSRRTETTINKCYSISCILVFFH